MPEDDYTRLTNPEGGAADGQPARINQRPGANKILIQALDTSGSMSGAPIRALKEGAMIIGEKLFQGEERAFEQFYTFTYNNNATGGMYDNIDQYRAAIQRIQSGGGTNFMSVFQKIQQILD